MIDLGEITGEPVYAPPPRRLSPRWPLRVLTLVAVLLAGGSAVPALPAVHRLWQLTLDRAKQQYVAAFDDTTLYVPEYGVAGERTPLSAYDLTTGKLRWQAAQAGGTETRPEPVPAAGVVLVAGDTAFPEAAAFNERLALYDTAVQALAYDTGEPLWRAPGEFHEQDGSRVLTVDHDKDSAETGLNVLDVKDGHLLWRLPLSGVGSWVHDGDRLFVLTKGGDLRVYRYADGSPLPGARVAWTDGTRLEVAAGSLIVGDARGAAVYDEGTLTERWRAPGTLTRCGEQFCGRDDAKVTGYERTTGRILWTVTGRSTIPASTGWFLLGYDSMDEDRDAKASVLDARTGAVLLPSLPGHSIAGVVSGTVLVTVATTAVELIDPARHRVTLIGKVPAASGVGAYVAIPGYLLLVEQSRVTVNSLGVR